MARFIFILFFSLICLQVPTLAASVGDRVAFDAVISGVSGKLTFEATEVNAGSDEFTYKQIWTQDGRDYVHQGLKYSQKYERFFQELAYDLQSCEEYGLQSDGTGALENIDFDGRTFSACHIHRTAIYDDGSETIIDSWYGNVLFGLMKMVEAGNSTHPASTLSIISFIKN